jgi:hypothetical protein
MTPERSPPSGGFLLSYLEAMAVADDTETKVARVHELT